MLGWAKEHSDENFTCARYCAIFCRERVRSAQGNVSMNSSMKIKSSSSRLSVMDAINTRCSVRHYAADKLDRATVQALLDAAVRAPTAIHAEPWAFVVIQDTRLLRQISDIAKAIFVEEGHHDLDRGGHALDIFQQPEFNIFYDSSTLIVICGKHTGHSSRRLLARSGEPHARGLRTRAGDLRDRLRGGRAEHAGNEGAARDAGGDDGHRADHRWRPGRRNSRFTSQAPTGAGLEVRPPVTNRAFSD